MNNKTNTKAFWDVNYYNHPPLTAEMIQLAEKILAIKLPETFVELLKIQNGGFTKGFAFSIPNKKTAIKSPIPLLELFGIVTNQDILTTQNILDSNNLANKWHLPDKQILLAGDDERWWITLDYRKGSIPTVQWVTREYKEGILIANNFDEFINGLVLIDKFAGNSTNFF